MSEQKLESFKIADTRKPTVGSVTKRATEEEEKAAQSESQSLGFKRIEGALEKEDEGAVRAALRKIREDLETLENDGGKGANANKQKAAAKKAIVAVDRTTELMDYLFQTKAKMQAPPETK